MSDKDPFSDRTPIPKSEKYKTTWVKKDRAKILETIDSIMLWIRLIDRLILTAYQPV